MESRTIILAAALAGCSNGDRLTPISAGETTYHVPSSHIMSITREPHQFVRIKPPEAGFEFVYDSREAERLDAAGWPIIFSLNDESAPAIERHAIGDLKVVCRRAVNPRGGCGMKLSHEGAEWAVLFPNSRFGEALQIRDRALAALEAYEVES